MQKQQKKNIAIGMVPAVISLATAAGVMTVFSACGPKMDGPAMGCQVCQNYVAGSAGALAVVFAGASFVKNRALRLALQVLAVIGAIVTFFLPGTICPLCMMKTMRCWTVFAPFVRIMSALTALSGLAAAWIGRKLEPAKAAIDA